MILVSLLLVFVTPDPNEYDRTIFLLNVMQSFWIMNTATNTDQLHELWKAYRGIVKSTDT